MDINGQITKITEADFEKILSYYRDKPGKCVLRSNVQRIPNLNPGNNARTADLYAPIPGNSAG
jgi:hypothetical protein